MQFVGRTERDVAWDIVLLYHEEGAANPSFESIVGSGPTGSRPHARAGKKKIGAGEMVVIDTGCTVDGYTSDCTRTFAAGSVNGKAREVYEIGLAAQEAALGAIRAGLPGIYVSGEFGVRIENGVVVTADGIEDMTGFRKDWVEVG